MYSFGDFPSKAKLAITSEKLIGEGFSFKYGIEEVYDQTVEYFKAKGLLNWRDQVICHLHRKDCGEILAWLYLVSENNSSNIKKV